MIDISIMLRMRKVHSGFYWICFCKLLYQLELVSDLIFCILFRIHLQNMYGVFYLAQLPLVSLSEIIDSNNCLFGNFFNSKVKSAHNSNVRLSIVKMSFLSKKISIFSWHNHQWILLFSSALQYNIHVPYP